MQTRRPSVWPLLALSLFFLVASLQAQVFPTREYLDVVTLSDGTILKGIITERVPERYLEIEVYGGSIFVVGEAQISVVERQRNSDYSTTWIQVDLEELRRETEERAAAATAGTGDGSRGGIAGPSPANGGIVLGVYTGPLVRWFGGPDWEAGLDESPGAENEYHWDGEFGLYFSHLSRPVFLAHTPWVWGLRGGLGMAGRSGQFSADNYLDSGQTLEYEEHTFLTIAPLELLGGVSAGRFALVAGLGPSIAFLEGEPSTRIFLGGDEVSGDPVETDRDVSLALMASLGGYVQLGSWQLDLRLFYDRLLLPWNDDREVVHNAVGLTLGVGYRLGGR